MSGPRVRIRAVTDRLHARRLRAHGALQLAGRAPVARRRVHLAHRGHRRRRATARSGVEGIYRRWLARLDFDEGPFRQSDNVADHVGRGRGARTRTATSTPATARASRSTSAPRATRKPGYDGFCRDRGLERGPTRRRCAFACRDEGVTVVHDVIRGDVDVRARQLRGLHRRALQRRRCSTRWPTPPTTAA